MNCQQAREQLADRWAGALAADDVAQLQAHLTACEDCRTEAAGLDALWTALGRIPIEEPSAQSALRFQEMLSAYRLGLQHGNGAARFSLSGWLANLWPKQMAAQLAVAAATLFVGLGVGHWFTATRHDTERIAQMGEEVKSMRQLVTLSLLQQQSASERLQGINWSVRMESPDEQVTNALLTTLNTDANVNVRLAALDALQRFSQDQRVRRGLRQALPSQTSPLVQIALIDWIAQSPDRQSAEQLRLLQSSEDLNPAVKLRITNALASIKKETL